VRQAIVACERCPRLRDYCAEVARVKKRAFRDQDYWGRPVPGFGDPAARLLVIGLAPAAHGGNRTGRVFTGDSSGSWLYEALHAHGFASQPFSTGRDDGQKLTGAYVTAAARCAPPANKPTPAELDRCRGYLEAEIRLLRQVRVVLGLGRIGHEAWLRAAGWWALPARERPVFAHGADARWHAADRELPPEPAEHEHRQTHAPDVGRGVPPRARGGGCGLRGTAPLRPLRAPGSAAPGHPPAAPSSPRPRPR
jgi:uracil-DNA glycosylase family 4